MKIEEKYYNSDKTPRLGDLAYWIDEDEKNYFIIAGPLHHYGEHYYIIEALIMYATNTDNPMNISRVFWSKDNSCGVSTETIF